MPQLNSEYGGYLRRVEEGGEVEPTPRRRVHASMGERTKQLWRLEHAKAEERETSTAVGRKALQLLYA